MDVDRSRGSITRGDQWVQPVESTALRALWVAAVRPQDIPFNSWVTTWNPMLEANPRDAEEIINRRFLRRLQVGQGETEEIEDT